MGRDRSNTGTQGSSKERMQRVRVGVTGLAGVVLVVALATAIATGVRRSANETGPGTVPALVTTTPAAAANAADPPTEPLAKLGVAPDASAGKDAGTPTRPAR